MIRQLRALQRNMLALKIGENSPVVWGRTRFGGNPDVPADFEWPTFVCDTFYDEEVKPRPLAFLAQFDCGALSCMDYDGLLPKHGILSFFYELGSGRWGYAPNDIGSARVYWFDGKEPLSLACFPSSLEEEFQLPRMPIGVTSAPSFPQAQDYVTMFPQSKQIEIEQEIEEKMEQDKLLGYPDILQGNMTLQCELVTRGYYLGNEYPIDEQTQTSLGIASMQDWILLFQLNSFETETFDLTFGDCGSLYFYIRRSDLQARNFNHIWAIVQSC